MGHSPKGHKELDTTERLSTDTSTEISFKNLSQIQFQRITVCHQHILTGTSLAVQWLRLRTPNAGGLGPIPGQGTRSHMPQPRTHSHN